MASIAALAAFGAYSFPLSEKQIDSLAYEARAFQEKEPQQAIDLSYQVLSESQKLGYDKGMSYGYMRLGSVYAEQHLNDSALHYLYKALSIRLKNQNYAGASGVCTELNHVYIHSGKLDSAYAVLVNSLRFNQLANDSIRMVETYHQLGHFSVDYRDSNLAFNYYQQALDLAIRIQFDEGIAYSYSGFGNYYYAANDYDSALYYFQLVDSCLLLQDNQPGLARNYNNLGLCYQGLEDYTSALYYFNLSFDKFQELGLNYNEALIYNNLGVLYVKKGDADSAIYYINKALPFYLGSNNLQDAATCYKYLSLAYANKLDFRKAYTNQIAFKRWSDSLLDAQKVSSIAEMRTIYETEQKEKEILLLEIESQKQLTQRNLFLGLALILFILVAALIFFYLQRKKLASKNLEIADKKIASLLQVQEIKTNNAMIQGQEEERQRIAEDLHDRLGGMLSTIKLLFNSLEEKLNVGQSENRDQFGKAVNMIDEAVTEVRRISHDLNTGIVSNFGLVMALEELTESINESNMLDCKLMVYGMEERLDARIAIQLYRMIQEVLNNVLKHAKASTTSIQINRNDHSISVTVEDNGVGFDSSKSSTGMGLSNIAKRAQKLGGSYHIDSQPGRGAVSIIEIPLGNESAN